MFFQLMIIINYILLSYFKTFEKIRDQNLKIFHMMILILLQMYRENKLIKLMMNYAQKLHRLGMY